MAPISSFIRAACIVLTFSIGMFFAAGYWAYEVFKEGEMLLDKAPGLVSILREKDTQIMTIRGENWESISYAQGFASAQSRLWQMEKMRRLAAGKLCEILGKDALPIDEFMRYVGIRRLSQASFDLGLSPETFKTLKAYADGVNDFVQGVSLIASEKT